jgi:hypothetical protein
MDSSNVPRGGPKNPTQSSNLREPTTIDMGLFDESDEDEQPVGSSTAAPNSHGYDYDNVDDEDPLDAYMNSLNSTADATSTSASQRQPSSSGGGRLDHDAEDEATSHWNVATDTSQSNGDGSRLLGKSEYGEEDEDAPTNGMDQVAVAAREARSAMSTTFIRAGGNNKQSAKDARIGNNDDDADEEGGYDSLHKIHQMQHQEVDPLDVIDHRAIKYESFRRVFIKPRDTEAGHAWRKEHDVVCTPGKYDPILGFGELEDNGDSNKTTNSTTTEHKIVPPELIKAIAKSGYDSPTIVQSQTLPVALSGNDALITAATGSGKTLSYIWPMIIHIMDQPEIMPGVDGPIGIVLIPTRELAKQVYKYAKLFMEACGGKVCEVSGGNRGTWELTKELKKGCEIIVSTPGRLIDMVKKKGTNLQRVTFVVLDEADRMLDLGFEKQVSSILENVRPQRQTLLLSATFGKRVERVARSWLKNPVR